MLLNFSVGAIVFLLPQVLLSPDACKVSYDKDQLIKVVEITAIAGFLALTFLFKCFQTAPAVWLEVKLLQTWVNTAMLAVFALFTYPFALIIGCLQMILLFARPLHNPGKQPMTQWVPESLLSLVWVPTLTSVFVLLLFGNVLGSGGIKDWQSAGEYFLAQTVMSYQCVGHRLWLFACFGVLPCVVSTVKVVLN